MATDVTVMFGPSDVPASYVFFNENHFNLNGGHFLRILSMCFQLSAPISWDEYCTLIHYNNSLRKWPPIGLKCFYAAIRKIKGTYTHPK